jgi:hypothetical protein
MHNFIQCGHNFFRMQLNHPPLRVLSSTIAIFDPLGFVGLLHRQSGEVRAKVAPSRTKKQVHAHLRDNVTMGSPLYTDDFNAYMDLTPEFAHAVVKSLGSLSRWPGAYKRHGKLFGVYSNGPSAISMCRLIHSII